MPHRLVEATYLLRHHPWLGYAAGLVVFALAFLVRFVAQGWLDDVPFITLFPAILIAALIGGLRVGVMVTILSFLFAWYFFIPAIGGPAAYITLGLFCVTAAIQLYIIDTLNRTVDRLSAERDHVHVLFRELQHRVANNMAFVASLLNLKRRTLQVSPQDAAQVLDDAQARLETIARLHRRLYDPAIVNQPVSAYLETLARDILEGSGASNVVCIVETNDITLDLTRLVTLSLLINEVITNSIKHGFSGRDSGTITIKLMREGPNHVLTVKDDGRGLHSAPETSGTLGMMIIRSLASQLGGEINWSNHSGTTARLEFPAVTY